jgi:hypothetical protein
MGRRYINIGAQDNDGSGDTLRVTGAKVNDTFDEIYGLIADPVIAAVGTDLLLGTASKLAIVTANLAAVTSVALNMAKILNAEANADRSALAASIAQAAIGGFMYATPALGMAAASKPSFFVVPGVDATYATLYERTTLPFDFSGGVLPANVTFSRPSIGTRVNAAGALVTEIANTARFDYSTTSIRTNLLTYSNQLDQAAPVKDGTGVGPVVTADNAVAPDGTMTADTVVFNKGSGETATDQSILNRSIPATTTGAQYTFSLWLRSAAPTEIVTRVGASSYTKLNVTNVWQRFTVTFAALAVNNSISFGLRGTISTPGIVTATVEAWGLQFETGAVATPLITTGATIASVADKLRGILLEPERTNLVTYSAPAALTQIALRGPRTAITSGDKVGDFPSAVSVPTAAGTTEYAYVAFTAPAYLNMVFSVYATADQPDAFIGAGGSASSANFTINIQGSIPTVFTNTKGPGKTIRSYATRDYAQIQAFAGAARYANQVQDPAYFSGFQIEQGPVPTSYIPTNGAPVTRAADVLTLDWGARGGPMAGSVTVRYTFDDGSTQDVVQALAAGKGVVNAATLARSAILRAELVDPVAVERGRTPNYSTVPTIYGSIAAMKLGPIVGRARILVDGVNPPVIYGYVAGNYTGKVDNINVVQLDAVPITTGALLRIVADGMSWTRVGIGTVPLSLGQILKAYSVFPEQFGAIGDGNADDAAAIRLALDHLKTVATATPGQVTPGVLLIPPGSRYKCGSQIPLDARYHTLALFGTLDFSSWSGTYIVVAGSLSPLGNGYGYHGAIEGPGLVKGSGANNAGLGILFESNVSSSATRMRLSGFSLTKCGTGIRFGNRAYNHLITNMEIFDCDTGIHWPADTADNDERNNIRDTDIYNCRRGIWHQRAAGNLLNSGGSVDYVERVFDLENGKYTSDCVHYEASNWKNLPFYIAAGSGSAIFKEGWIVQQQNFGGVTNFFYVGAGSHAKLENVRTNNTNNVNTADATTPTTWATGPGRFEIKGLEPAFEFGGFPQRLHSSYNVLSDGEFERSITEDMRWIREDTQTINSRYTGQNIKMSRTTSNQYAGSGGLRVDKQFGGFSNAAFYLTAIPVRYGDKVLSGFRVRTAPDRTGSDSRLVVRAGFAVINGFLPGRIVDGVIVGGDIPNVVRFEPPGEQTITPPSTGYSLVIPYNGASQIVAPSWATHYLVDINAFQASEASWIFGGLWQDRV